MEVSRLPTTLLAMGIGGGFEPEPGVVMVALPHNDQPYIGL
jgi:hypothetical protein